MGIAFQMGITQKRGVYAKPNFKNNAENVKHACLLFDLSATAHCQN